MKQVVENGNEFEKSHFFMMLINLTVEELAEPMITSAIRIIAEELSVSEFDYVQFIQGLKDIQLQKAFFEVRQKVFVEED